MAISRSGTSTLHVMERGARVTMSAVAIVATVVALTFKTGLISSTQEFNRQSWYLVTQGDGYSVTSELEDEGTCRLRESSASACHSGAALMDRPHGVLPE